MVIIAAAPPLWTGCSGSLIGALLHLHWTPRLSVVDGALDLAQVNSEPFQFEDKNGQVLNVDVWGRVTRSS